MLDFTQEEINKIDFLSKELFWEISKNDIFTPELELLLGDWVLALQNKLFFASLGIFVVFLEKYLRDILIYKELQIWNPWTTIQDWMLYIENTELKIEDDKSKDKPTYNFKKICTDLLKYWIITTKVKNELLDKYQKYRNPVQHWLYSRLARNTTIPQKNIYEATHIESWKTAKTKMTNNNPIVRNFILPWILKDESLNLLSYLNDLITHTKNNLTITILNP